VNQVSKQRNATRLPQILLSIFVAFWLAMAIAPRYRQDWLLENVLVFIAILALILSYPKKIFTRTAYVCIFLFLVAHEVGAHYTYSEVPYHEWLTRSHLSLSSSQRNNFDRFVHFLYGLLITPAAFELIAHVARPKGAWRCILPVSFIMSHSLFYELVEWLAAAVFGGDLGIAYLGTQGDPWDAQRDMLAATMGSVLAMLVIILCRRHAMSFDDLLHKRSPGDRAAGMPSVERDEIQ